VVLTDDFRLVLEKHALNLKTADVNHLINAHKVCTASEKAGVRFNDALRGLAFDQTTNNWLVLDKSTVDFLDRNRTLEKQPDLLKDIRKDSTAFSIDPELKKFFFNTIDRSKKPDKNMNSN